MRDKNKDKNLIGVVLMVPDYFAKSHSCQIVKLEGLTLVNKKKKLINCEPITVQQGYIVSCLLSSNSDVLMFTNLKVICLSFVDLSQKEIDIPFGFPQLGPTLRITQNNKVSFII